MVLRLASPPMAPVAIEWRLRPNEAFGSSWQQRFQRMRLHELHLVGKACWSRACLSFQHVPNNVRIICLWDRRIHKNQFYLREPVDLHDMLKCFRKRQGWGVASFWGVLCESVTYLRSSVTLHAWQSSWPLHTSHVLYSVHGAEVAFGELSGRASCTPWHQKSLTTRPTKPLSVRVTRFKIRLVAVYTLMPLFIHSCIRHPIAMPASWLLLNMFATNPTFTHWIPHISWHAQKPCVGLAFFTLKNLKPKNPKNRTP